MRVANDACNALTEHQGKRFQKMLAQDLCAYQLVCLAYGIDMVDRGSRDKWLSLTRRAVEMDPEWARARAFLAAGLYHIAVTFLTKDVEGLAAECLSHAERALELSPNMPYVVNVCSMAHRVFGSERLALQLAQRCFSTTNGNFHIALYEALIACGRSQEVVALAQKNQVPLEKSLRLAGHACVTLGRFEEAEIWYQKAFETQEVGGAANSGRNIRTLAAMANAVGHLDRPSDANEIMTLVHKLDPEWTIAGYEQSMRRYWREKPQLVGPLVGGLRNHRTQRIR